MKRTARAATLLGIGAALCCCAANPLPEIRAAYARGDYEAARELLLDLERSDGSNRHVYALERAMAELALAQPDIAERTLRGARDRLDQLESDGALAWLSAVLLDDRQLAYGGADYEKVLVRALLAVANLLGRGGDAQAYALQVLEKQRQLIQAFELEGENPKQRYQLVAFGSYLRGILAEEDPLNAGVAERAFARAVEIEPGFRVGAEALERARHGQHSQPGHGVVHVLGLVGRGPFRVESEEPVTREVLAIVQILWAQIRDRVTFPNIARVPIPALAFYQDNPTELHVAVDGQRVGATEVVTDVERTAQREFEAMRSYIVARAALRRAFKIGVTEGLKEVLNPKEREAQREQRPRRPGNRPWNQQPRQQQRSQADPLVDLAISLGGLLWTAFEQADLRCWSLLPARFATLRVELPAGEYQLELRAGLDGRAVGPAQRVRVTVRDGFNSYVLGIAPTLQGGPEPLTSEPSLTLTASPNR